MLKVLLLSLSRQYTVDGQYIPSLFIEPEVRHDKTSYILWECLTVHQISIFNQFIMLAADHSYFQMGNLWPVIQYGLCHAKRSEQKI